MIRVIYNADDFGYSEAVTLGIIKAHKDGCINSTTLMTNMESAKFAAELSRSYPNLYVGQHSNIVIGRPCSPLSEVQSLVDENGFFNTKHRLKNNIPLDKNEIRREVFAQAERFKELMGHYPTHIEGHAIHDEGLFWAIREVATELGVHYTDIERLRDGSLVSDRNNSGYEIPVHPDVMYYQDNVSINYWLDDVGNILEKELVEMHTHPGYLDQFILDNSSYSIERPLETKIACSAELKKWAKENNVVFVGFDSINKI